ncbi:CRE-ZTF-2 protein [Caenorhabditis remanei]|uniref:CRE-ZTF-2 protein n=1 Tax=Caenorhabditis remanei TaxID=31234 RepID=E3NE10_CAERE|nr:CRE-ZTF-2 protein [Caenorhabditis remanei]
MNCESLLTALDVSTLLSSLSSPDKELRRKRRRGEVANPSNTLDALVARKADDQPFEKRYLSEQEAIEGPDDEIEMKKMELDPDVSTRTCSTCGYQGKWVSEMIRHKRVHTSERPFKCRYCSRTSKWKADLIRHVAKTHGIRVVSKYSRSKVFDTNNTSIDCSSDSDRCSSLPEKRQVFYRCQLCSFEDERVSVLTHHITHVHNTSPCVCRCGAKFEDVQGALAHSNGNGTCGHVDMIYNVMPTYEKASPLSPCRSESSSDSGIQTDPEEELQTIPSALPTPQLGASPLLLSPTLPVLQSPQSFLPDIHTALLSLQPNPLMSLYLASLLQSSLLSGPPALQFPPMVPMVPQEEVIDVEM